VNKFSDWLCKIGIHRWKNIAQGLNPDRFRKCKRCQRLQMFDDYACDYMEIN